MTEETVYKAQEKAKLDSKSALPAYILIAVGVTLLFVSMLDIHIIDYLWPVFIVAPGLLLMYPSYNSTADDRSSWSFLAVPGAIFIAVGTLSFVMNLFNHFEAWSYSWPLIPAAVAAAIIYITRYDNNFRLELRAHKFIRFMALLTAGLAFFFEIIVFENFNPIMAIGLIVMGLFLLLQERKRAKAA